MKKSKNQKKLLWKKKDSLLLDHRQRVQRQNDGDELGYRNICGSGQIKKRPPGVRDRKSVFKREHTYFTMKGGESQ